MVDNGYSTNNCKSSKTSIGSIITNPKMLKFVPDHFKTKKMSKHAVKKLPFRYAPDWYMTQEIYDKAILENGGVLKSLSFCGKNQKMSNKAVNYTHALNLSMNATRLKKCLTKLSILFFLQYNLFLML